MHRGRIQLWHWLVALAPVAACSVTSPRAVTTEIRITPASVELAVGDTVSFAAVAVDADGNVIQDVTRLLRPLHPAVLEITDAEHGELKAIGAGRTSVTVTGAGVVGTAEATVSCPATAGPTIHGGRIETSELWRAADGPHRIEQDLTIQGSESNGEPVTVTIESCAKVEVAKDLIIRVGAGGPGALRALGAKTPEGPTGEIRLAPKDSGAPVGYWRGIVFDGSSASLLQHVVLSGAGGRDPAGPPQQGAIRIEGEAGRETELSLVGVVVEGSAEYGIVLSEHGRLSMASTDLTINGSGAAPWFTPPQNASSIPRGQYTGNGEDLVEVSAGTLSRTGSWSVRSVPYLLTGDVIVAAPEGETAPFLTLIGGVTLRFAQDTRLSIGGAEGQYGGIVATGSAVDPVVLTSAASQPSPGDWVGLIIGENTTPGSELEFAIISYAGAPSGLLGLDGDFGNPDHGNVILQVDLGRETLQQCKIEQSAGYGIVHAYSGSSENTRYEGANDLAEESLAFGGESVPNPLSLVSETCEGDSCEPVLRDDKPIPLEYVCGPNAKSPPLTLRYRQKPVGIEKVQSYAVMLKQIRPSVAVRWIVHGIAASQAGEDTPEPISLAEGTLPDGATEVTAFAQPCPEDTPECIEVREVCAAADKICSKLKLCRLQPANKDRPGACADEEKQCNEAPCDREKLAGPCGARRFSYVALALDTRSVEIPAGATLAEAEQLLLPHVVGTASLVGDLAENGAE